jgi:hypothetical protein
MKGKITLLVGGAVGYVLGARAGRERYEQIKSQATNLWQDPKVQQKKHEAQEFAKSKAPVVKDAASTAASAAKDKVGVGSGKSESESETSAESPAPDVTTPSEHSTPAYPTAATTGLN